MIKVEAKGITERELNRLENLLDKTLGRKGKRGITVGPAFEEVEGRLRAGRGFDYQSKDGRASLRADLERSGSYHVELGLDVNAGLYDRFLDQCRRAAPSVYNQLPKPNEDARKVAYRYNYILYL